MRIRTGDVFGRLTVVGGPVAAGKDARYFCRCECGAMTQPMRGNLLRGTSRSCGCMQVELASARRRTHGMRESATYRAWHGMKQRCQNPRMESYHRYGGRGIGFAPAWAEFANFIADMGECPDGLTLDRIDVNGHYEPGNCRWVSNAVQQRNKSTNRLISYAGKTQCLTAWAEELGITPTSLLDRLKAGWSVEAAVTKPPRVISRKGTRLSSPKRCPVLPKEP